MHLCCSSTPHPFFTSDSIQHSGTSAPIFHHSNGLSSNLHPTWINNLLSTDLAPPSTAFGCKPRPERLRARGRTSVAYARHYISGPSRMAMVYAITVGLPSRELVHGTIGHLFMSGRGHLGDNFSEECCAHETLRERWA